MPLSRLFAHSAPRRRAVPPAEAVTDKLGASAEREVLANLVLAMWEAHVVAFRDDEQSVETAAFQEMAGAVSQLVAALPAERAPDPLLIRQILAVLPAAHRERVAGLHERIDELKGSCRGVQRELNATQLASSWQIDELDRCRSMIKDALRGRETVLPSGAAQPLVSDLLATLLNVQRPAPPVETHQGRRRERSGSDIEEARQAPAKAGTGGEHATVVAVLREVLAGNASAGRLARIIEDRELCLKLADLAGEHRTYKGLLQRIGLLPREG